MNTRNDVARVLCRKTRVTYGQAAITALLALGLGLACYLDTSDALIFCYLIANIGAAIALIRGVTL